MDEKNFRRNRPLVDVKRRGHAVDGVHGHDGLQVTLGQVVQAQSQTVEVAFVHEHQPFGVGCKRPIVALTGQVGAEHRPGIGSGVELRTERLTGPSGVHRHRVGALRRHSDHEAQVGHEDLALTIRHGAHVVELSSARLACPSEIAYQTLHHEAIVVLLEA